MLDTTATSDSDKR